MRVLFSAQRDGGTSQLVAGGVYPLRCQKDDGHGTVDNVLCVLDTFYQVLFAVDKSRYQFGGVDVTAAHFKEMCGRF